MANHRVIFYDTPGKYRIVLHRGFYRFELWGASGGHSHTPSSRGAYVSAKLFLSETGTFFSYVGEKGTKSNSTVTFNGGGGAFPTAYDSVSYAYSGGGATDVRLVEGNWNNMESLKSRIIVAGGGGGGVNFLHYSSVDNPARGGCGGFLSGENGLNANCNRDAGTGYVNASGGEQRKGGKAGCGNLACGSNGKFGEGGTAVKPPRYDPWPSSGGGGGYFGGGSGGVHGCHLGSGAGGSSFVSGHKNCSSVSSSYSPSNEQFLGHVHYSGIVFHDIFYKNGNEQFESPTGSMEWDYIDGAIRITVFQDHCTCKTFDYQRINLFILTVLVAS
jgi:hypothetical protein